MTILDDIKAGRLTLDEAREKARRRIRRSETIGNIIVGLLVSLSLFAVLAWQIILPVIGLLWVMGGLG
ncbi:hypothetical protein [Ancylobacter polymorphus]|uniref:Uncharacterized protein n=1 Tax=Ancylobacter polymorphus TaxID=223390 RepID=A0A9E7A8M0_9HYPH|nr:hypothetical protein [Ancylobacter polymorphus]UOK71733.1 hypothetical protein K9D25_03120 [Ancylobacter polymorphus]